MKAVMLINSNENITDIIKIQIIKKTRLRGEDLEK